MCVGVGGNWEEGKGVGRKNDRTKRVCVCEGGGGGGGVVGREKGYLK